MHTHKPHCHHIYAIYIWKKANIDLTPGCPEPSTASQVTHSHRALLSYPHHTSRHCHSQPVKARRHTKRVVNTETHKKITYFTYQTNLQVLRARVTALVPHTLPPYAYALHAPRHLTLHTHYNHAHTLSSLSPHICHIHLEQGKYRSLPACPEPSTASQVAHSLKALLSYPHPTSRHCHSRPAKIRRHTNHVVNTKTHAKIKHLIHLTNLQVLSPLVTALVLHALPPYPHTIIARRYTALLHTNTNIVYFFSFHRHSLS